MISILKVADVIALPAEHADYQGYLVPFENPFAEMKPKSHKEYRWGPAMRMWDFGWGNMQIASVYGLSANALSTRIQKMRRELGWFPPRTPTSPPCMEVHTASTQRLLDYSADVRVVCPLAFGDHWKRTGQPHDLLIDRERLVLGATIHAITAIFHDRFAGPVCSVDVNTKGTTHA